VSGKTAYEMDDYLLGFLAGLTVFWAKAAKWGLRITKILI